MTNIVLLGLPGAGKSTLAAALSEQLTMQRCSIDELRGEYAEQFGYCAERAEELYQTCGAVAFHKYVCGLDAQLLSHFLSSGDRQIIDGSGGVVCDEGLTVLRRRTSALWVLVEPGSPEEHQRRLAQRGADDEQWRASGGEQVNDSIARAVEQLAPTVDVRYNSLTDTTSKVTAALSRWAA